MSLAGRIYAAAKRAGLDDDTRRAKCMAIVGKSSTKDMTDPELWKMLQTFEKEGYGTPKPSRVNGRADQLPFDGKYVPKMRALWIALYNLGVIDDRRDSAIQAFALGRQVPGLSDIRFIHLHRDGDSVIQGMKAMLNRAGVDFADRKPCPDYALKRGYKIAVAQWSALCPGGAKDFWSVVTDLVGRDASYRAMTDQEWIVVMNAFGERIRRRKKGRT